MRTLLDDERLSRMVARAAVELGRNTLAIRLSLPELGEDEAAARVWQAVGVVNQMRALDQEAGRAEESAATGRAAFAIVRCAQARLACPGGQEVRAAQAFSRSGARGRDDSRVDGTVGHGQEESRRTRALSAGGDEGQNRLPRQGSSRAADAGCCGQSRPVGGVPIEVWRGLEHRRNWWQGGAPFEGARKAGDSAFFAANRAYHAGRPVCSERFSGQDPFSALKASPNRIT